MSRGRRLAQASALNSELLIPRWGSVRIPTGMIIDLIIWLEVGLVVAAAFLAKILYIELFRDDGQTVYPYIAVGVAGGILTHYVKWTQGLHQPGVIVDWKLNLSGILYSVPISFLTLIALGYFLNLSSDFSRGWVLTWFGLSVAFLVVNRAVSAKVLEWFASSGVTERRIAVVAGDLTCLQLVDKMRKVPGVRIVGVFQLTRKTAEVQSSTIDDLISMGERSEFDEIIVSVSSASKPNILPIISDLSVLPVDLWVHTLDFNVPVYTVAKLGEAVLEKVRPKPTAMRDWSYVAKLVLDYVVGAVCLVLFAPLMLLIAAAIRIDSPGPVYFRQRRHGYNHSIIDVYKFRTMKVVEDGGQIEQARKNDPRITRVGRFLRRTSLDELPQLINVLKGEMSLVGPRPHAVAHNLHYRERMQCYGHRHVVKPGMTGWAQVNGFRGPTDDIEKMSGRVQLDLYYIENWSLLLDLRILALTPFVGFLHHNAL